MAATRSRINSPQRLFDLPRQRSHGLACGYEELTRGHAVARFLGEREPYVINWDSISIENSAHLPMPDPFETYVAEVDEMLG